MGVIVDGCSGPGGWDLGLAILGRAGDVVGLEWDADACATRAAVGLRTIRCDIAAYPPEAFARQDVEGFIASPPCPAFSKAGKREGLKDGPRLIRHAHRCRTGWTPPSARPWHHPESRLVLEPLRWVWQLRPRWVALEQVPDVLPMWRATAHALEAWGYSVWTGELNTADYGVGQTRRRAILIARRDGLPAGPPPPTHTDTREVVGRARKRRGPGASLFLEPWVSMAEVLGWGLDAEPALTVTGASESGGGPTMFGGARSRAVMGLPRRPEPSRPDDDPDGDGYRDRDWAPADEPARTVRELSRSWVVRTGANSMVTGRTADDLEPYERPIDEPAPTVDTKAGGAWHLQPGRHPNGDDPVGNRNPIPVDEPAPTIALGHDAANWRWVLNTGRDWQPEGGRSSAQQRPDLEPAPTVAGVEAQWWRERPATTVMGDQRIWPPGHKLNAGDEARLGQDEAREAYGDRAGTEAVRVTLDELAQLQAFPPGYPWAGSRSAASKQIGNAVPPLFAAHVLAPLLGLDPPASCRGRWW